MNRITAFAMSLGLLLTHCSDQKKDPATTAPDNSSNNTITTTTTTEQKPATNTAPEATGGSGEIIGTWQLQLDAYDENDNDLLDPEERAKATPNKMTYQFKADGSCIIQRILKGRYEIKKVNGKDQLTVYRERIPQEEDEDPLPDNFRILSVSSTELVLLMQASANDDTIWIFKRQ